MRNNYLFLPVRECPGSFKQSIFDRQNNVSVNLGQIFFFSRDQFRVARRVLQLAVYML
jgi:hypothetical protein